MSCDLKITDESGEKFSAKQYLLCNFWSHNLHYQIASEEKKLENIKLEY